MSFGDQVHARRLRQEKSGGFAHDFGHLIVRAADEVLVHLFAEEQHGGGLEGLDRQTKGLAELLLQAGQQGAAAGEEDAGGLTGVGATADIDETAVDVLREAADELLGVGLQDSGLRVGLRQMEHAREVADLEGFGGGKRLTGVVGDALGEEVAADVGGLDVGSAGTDEAERRGACAHVDDQHLLSGRTARQQEGLAVEQRRGLNGEGPESGGRDEIGDAAGDLGAEGEQQDLGFDAVRRHDLAVPDDLVEGIGNRVLGLESDDLRLLLTLHLRHLQGLLEEEETGGDHGDVAGDAVGLDEVAEGVDRRIKPLVVRSETRGELFDVETLEDEAAGGRPEDRHRDVGGGEIDDGGLILAHAGAVACVQRAGTSSRTNSGEGGTAGIWSPKVSRY